MNSVVFLCTSHTQNQENNCIYNDLKIIKYLGINITSTSQIHGLEDSPSSEGQFCPSLPINLTENQNSASSFVEIDKLNLKFRWKCLPHMLH